MSDDADDLQSFAQRGDQAAFASLVGRHGPLVAGVCRRILGSGQDADDAVQAVFLVLARTAKRLRHAPLAPWMHRVAQRIARRLARQRSRRRRQEEPVSALAAHLAAEVPTEEELAPLAMHLDDALAGLPARERDLLVLCYLQGRSQREAAAELGLPVGSASRLVEQGLTHLRRALGRHGVSATTIALAGLAGEAPAATPAAFAPALTAQTTTTIIAQATSQLVPSAAVIAAANIGTTMPILAIAIAATAILGFSGIATALVLKPAAEPPAAVAADPPPSPVIEPAIWPEAGLALPPADSTSMRWSPRGDALVVSVGKKGLWLATPAGLTPLGQGGYKDSDQALHSLVWLQGRTLLPIWGWDTDAALWELKDGKLVECMPSIRNGYALKADFSGKRGLVYNFLHNHAVAAAWLIDGTAAPQPITLPKTVGRQVAGLSWRGGNLVAMLFTPEEAALPSFRAPYIGQRWVSADLGVSWQQDTAWKPDRGHAWAPQNIGSLSTGHADSALTWALPDGGRLEAESPAVSSEPDPKAETALARPITSLTYRDAAGKEIARHVWPAASAGNAQPWPMAMIGSGSTVLVAAYSQFHRVDVGMGDMVWTPRITAWYAFDLVDGKLHTMAIPGDLKTRKTTLIASGEARTVLVADEDDLSTVLAVEPDKEPRQIRTPLDFPGTHFAIARADLYQRGVGGPLIQIKMAQAARFQPAIRPTAPGARVLVAWKSDGEPVVLHRSQGLDDAVTSFVWTPDGRQLAWIQGGRLRVWTR